MGIDLMWMTRKRITFPISAFMLLLCFSPVIAQTAGSMVSGVVVDAFGAVIPDARVTLVDGAGKEAIARSDFAGKFTFHGFAPGTYTLNVSRDGFGGNAQISISVPVDEGRVVRLQLGKACGGPVEGAGKVTEADRAEVFGLALADSIGKLALTVTERAGIAVSTENVDPAWLTPALRKRFNLTSTAELRDRPEHSGNFRFLSFFEFKTIGNCIAVSVNQEQAGVTFEYRKAEGRWTGQYVSGWIE